MPKITFEGKSYECLNDESVLACMTRHGVMIPSSCQAGACQTCMIRALSGKPTEASQQGLKDTLKAQNFFLACVCKPVEDMTIGLSTVSPRYQSKILEKTLLNETVVRLRLAVPEGFHYRAGQFVNLIMPGEELTRSYSLASLPGGDFLELHVKHVPDGRMSGWLFGQAEVGVGIDFYGPAGDCFYVPGAPEQPILLVGTGTGLAPLFGIMRDVIGQGHTGPVHLFHASLAVDGLYLVDELRQLAASHEALSYHPCVLHGEPPEGGSRGDITDLPASVLGSLDGFRVYLCGDPPIVNALRQKCFIAGASTQQIYADPFVFAPVQDVS